MKFLLFFIILFSFLKSTAQLFDPTLKTPGPPPGPGLKWIQTRSMLVNHSMSEWKVVADSVPDPNIPRDTIYIKIHDTLYLSKPNSLVPDTTLSSTGVIDQTFFSGGGNFIDLDTDITSYSKKQKRKRNKKHKTLHYSYIVPCTPDTVYGILLFNNREADENFGNKVDSGYWIGCSTLHFYTSLNEFIIPGRCKKTVYYQEVGTVLKKTTGYYSGTFYTIDGRKLYDWQVYCLVHNSPLHRYF